MNGFVPAPPWLAQSGSPGLFQSWMPDTALPEAGVQPSPHSWPMTVASSSIGVGRRSGRVIEGRRGVGRVGDRAGDRDPVAFSVKVSVSPMSTAVGRNDDVVEQVGRRAVVVDESTVQVKYGRCCW